MQNELFILEELRRIQQQQQQLLQLAGIVTVNANAPAPKFRLPFGVLDALSLTGVSSAPTDVTLLRGLLQPTSATLLGGAQIPDAAATLLACLSNQSSFSHSPGNMSNTELLQAVAAAGLLVGNENGNQGGAPAAIAVPTASSSQMQLDSRALTEPSAAALDRKRPAIGVTPGKFDATETQEEGLARSHSPKRLRGQMTHENTEVFAFPAAPSTASFSGEHGAKPMAAPQSKKTMREYTGTFPLPSLRGKGMIPAPTLVAYNAAWNEIKTKKLRIYGSSIEEIWTSRVCLRQIPNRLVDRVGPRAQSQPLLNKTTSLMFALIAEIHCRCIAP